MADDWRQAEARRRIGAAMAASKRPGSTVEGLVKKWDEVEKLAGSGSLKVAEEVKASLDRKAAHRQRPKRGR